MSDNKKDDGFAEVDESECPLSSNLLATPIKEESPIDKSSHKDKPKSQVTMDQKLKSVFGADILFDDHIPKNIKVTKPVEETDDIMSHNSNAHPILTVPSLNQEPRSPRPDSPARIEKVNSDAKPTPQPKNIDDETDVKKVTKARYKDLIANSDVFEDDRIEAAYIDNYISIFGTFKIGNYMLAFSRKGNESKMKVEHTQAFFLMPWTMISEIKATKDKVNLNYYLFEISLKDLRLMQFKVFDPYKNYHKRITDNLAKYNSFPELYAFKFFKRTDLESKFRGWEIFDLVKEYYRQGLDFEQEEKMEFNMSKGIKWRLVKNQRTTTEPLCDSYPEYLMIPGNINPVNLQIAIKFRSRNRFPVMTYYWHNDELPRGYATLWRCAQCNVPFLTNLDRFLEQIDRRRVLPLLAARPNRCRRHHYLHRCK